MHAARDIDRLPHRPPFVFLTRVMEAAPGESARGEWALAGDEGFFAGHFPGEPLVPGVLIAEALAQLSGLVLAAGSGVRLCRVDVKFTEGVVPPATIVLESRVARSLGELWQFDVEASVRGRAVAKGCVTLGAAGVRGAAP